MATIHYFPMGEINFKKEGLPSVKRIMQHTVLPGPMAGAIKQAQADIGYAYEQVVVDGEPQFFRNENYELQYDLVALAVAPFIAAVEN